MTPMISMVVTIPILCLRFILQFPFELPSSFPLMSPVLFLQLAIPFSFFKLVFAWSRMFLPLVLSIITWTNVGCEEDQDCVAEVDNHLQGKTTMELSAFSRRKRDAYHLCARVEKLRITSWKPMPSSDVPTYYWEAYAILGSFMHHRWNLHHLDRLNPNLLIVTLCLTIALHNPVLHHHLMGRVCKLCVAITKASNAFEEASQKRFNHFQLFWVKGNVTPANQHRSMF